MFAEREIIQSGWINTGFFMVNKKNKNFNLILNWLIDRLYKLCFMAPELGIYCDQTWLTYMVQIFNEDCLVLKHPGYNVSYWNIKNRNFSKKICKSSKTKIEVSLSDEKKYAIANVTIYD